MDGADSMRLRSVEERELRAWGALLDNSTVFPLRHPGGSRDPGRRPPPPHLDSGLRRNDGVALGCFPTRNNFRAKPREGHSAV